MPLLSPSSYSNVFDTVNVDAVTDPSSEFFSEDSTGLGWVGLVGVGSVWKYNHDLLVSLVACFLPECSASI